MARRKEQSAPDDFPLLEMMAAQESGASDFSEFMNECDGVDFKLWGKYIQRGPSRLRTQLLLAQLIQMVGGFGGAKGLTMDKILPYYPLLTGKTAKDIRSEKAKRMRDNNIQSLLDKKLGGG